MKALLISLLFLSACSPFREEPTPENVLAFVNGRVIYESEVNGRISRELKELKRRELELKQWALEKTIRESLIAYESNRLGLPSHSLLKMFESLDEEKKQRAQNLYIGELEQRSLVRRVFAPSFGPEEQP